MIQQSRKKRSAVEPGFLLLSRETKLPLLPGDAGVVPPGPAPSTPDESSPLTLVEKPDSPSRLKRAKRQLEDTTTTTPILKKPLPVPQYTMGAGNDLGLSLILHSQVDKYFLTSGTFEGFKVSTYHRATEKYVILRNFGHSR